NLYRAFFPAIRVAMRADMRIDAAGAARGNEKVRAALDRIEAELQPSGYLVGDRFSVADLTAAALLAPAVSPPEFPSPPGPLPEPVARWRDSLAGRPAFRWAAEMYRRHRGTSAEIAACPPRPSVRGSVASWHGLAKHADAFRLSRSIFNARDVRNIG